MKFTLSKTFILSPFPSALLEKPASHTPSLTQSPNGKPVLSVWKSWLDLACLCLPPWQPCSLSLLIWPCHILSSEEKISCLEPLSSTTLTSALRCVLLPTLLDLTPLPKKLQQNDWCRWLDLLLIEVLLILADNRLSWLDLSSETTTEQREIFVNYN